MNVVVACLLMFSLFFSASSKTISGLLEFDSKTEAVEVLTVLNHYQIRIPSKSMRETSITAHSVSLMLGTSQIFLNVELENTSEVEKNIL